MGKSFVGFMSQLNDYHDIRLYLEESGFRDSGYIIYFNNGENDSFWASISANNDQQKNKGKEILKKLDTKKSYYFKNADIEDAKSFDALKKKKLAFAQNQKSIQVLTLGIEQLIMD
ncbi:hypothetical protein [Soonwooa sp.]|uniref:hypothetical protein n=1 Tax=Soonwooa sp. TaxID=1938592 RepID=UPI0028A9F720|nr:hypothetical protein [Soonwooa sp.]